MKMQNKEIVDFLNTCVSMKKKSLPVRLAYAIKKNVAAVQEAASAYTAEREELIRRSSTSNALLSLMSSGIIRYFLFTRAKLAAACATLFFVQPVFSVTCLAVRRFSNTCFPFWSTTLYRFILFLIVFPYLYQVQIVPAEYLHELFVTVLLFK